MADGILKVGTITNSAGSGNIAIGSGVTVNVNRPAFEAVLSSDQGMSNDTVTKITFDSEEFDTDNAYDNSTNYRFTVPSGSAGKYYIYLITGLKSGASDNFQYGGSYLYKNGSAIRVNWIDTRTGTGRDYTLTMEATLDLSVGDYLEAFGYLNQSSSTPLIMAARGTIKLSTFGAYRIGA